MKIVEAIIASYILKYPVCYEIKDETSSQI